jgi:putative transposase
MVRYRRLFVPGATYFFTVALQDRTATTLTDNIDLLRFAFRKARERSPFQIDAIVVLPDHWHAVFTLPDGGADYSGRLRLIKAAFTYALRKRGAELRARDGAGFVLWQRRFWEHTIRDEEDLGRHIDYIHYNQVKHGYVSAPTDWPYSSLSRFVRRGVLPAEWGSGGITANISAGEP